MKKRIWLGLGLASIPAVGEASAQSFKQSLDAMLSDGCSALVGADRAPGVPGQTVEVSRTRKPDELVTRYYDLLGVELQVPSGALSPPGQPFQVGRRNIFDVTVRTSYSNAPRADLFGSGLVTACTTYSFTDATRTIWEDISAPFRGTNATLNASPAVAGGTQPVSGASRSIPNSFSGSGSAAFQPVKAREQGLDAILERINRFFAKKEADKKTAQIKGWQVASLDPVPPAPAPQDDPWDIFAVDFAVGSTNVERLATTLEGPNTSESVWYQGAIAVAPTPWLTLGVAGLQDEAESPNLTGPGSFSSSTTQASGFVSVSGSGFTLSGAYTQGEGTQQYQRGYTSTISGTTTDNLFEGEFDRDYTAASVGASYTAQLGWLAITPRASLTSYTSEIGEYSETDIGASSNGLAMRYAAVSDEWTETRLGLAGSFVLPVGDLGAIKFSAAADQVITLDAETPTRTAFFVQDLRGTPLAINFQVDNLDEEFIDISAELAFQTGFGFEVYGGGYKRSGHDYIEADGVFGGVRLSF